MMFENHLKSLIVLFFAYFSWTTSQRIEKNSSVLKKKSEFLHNFTLRKSVKIGKIEK